jgi:hypothetical protein
MAKANQAYHKRDAAGVAPCQVMTLANHLAKQAVKAHWRDQGRKLQLIEVSELVREARTYLTTHPELIDLATERYRDFVKRSLAQRQSKRRKPSQ